MKQAIKLLLSLALVLAALSGIEADINAAGRGSVSGRVLYNGQGISGIKVYLVPEAEVAKMPRKIPDARVAVGEGGLTNAEGRYTITGVPEGSYQVFIFDEHAPSSFVGQPGFWGEVGEKVPGVGDGATVAHDVELIRAIQTKSPQNGEIVPKTPAEFLWETCPGAASYTLSIFDAQGRLLHEEKGITGTSQKTLFSWALGGVFTWQVTAYNRQGGIIGQSLFPPEKRPVFLLGQPSRPPVLWSLMVGGETGNGRLRNPKKTFLRTDESVAVWQEWANVRGEHVVVARFYNPLGQQYHEIRSIIRPSSLKTGQWINIAGHRAAEIPGQWKVEIWVDNQLLRTETFEVAP